MRNCWVASSLAATALLVASSAFDAADARRGGGHGGGGHVRAGGGGHAAGVRSMGRPSVSMRYKSAPSMGIRPGGNARVYAGRPAFQGGVYHGRHHGQGHAHRYDRHRHVGVPLGLYAGYGAYGYYYGGTCDWLRQQALHTRNVYWWDRYYACTAGYEY